MINRTGNELQKFKKEIDKVWKLSIQEDDFLNNVLGLILIQESKKASELLESYLNEDWEEILEMIPSFEIEGYASNYLNMVEVGDCEEKYIEDFDDYEIMEECKERGLVTNESGDIISAMNLEEMTNLFLSFSSAKQNEVINNFKNS